MSENIKQHFAPGVEYHYFLLVFKTSYGEKSHYIGCEKNRVSLKQIKSAKLSCGMRNDAMLMSCSYLGKFTGEEFTAG